MRDYKAFVKYSKAGPRYTSYPTAVEFNANFKYEEYIEILKKQDRSLSLYFHLPFVGVPVIFVVAMLFIQPKKRVKKGI